MRLTPHHYQQHQRCPSRQKGVVLLITLIMLVSMTLAAIALVRSVDTTNLVSGNLAFQQASAQAADLGTEQAIAYLYSSTLTGLMNCDGTGAGITCPTGYKSFYEPALEPPTPVSGGTKTWEDFWASIKAVTGVVPLNGLPTGYSGAFVVEAMCSAPRRQGCAILTSTTTVTVPQGQDMGGQNRPFGDELLTTNMGYFRVTTRIEGPRNSVGYVQTLLGIAII